MKDLIRIELEMEQKTCGRCKKISSEYHELKLQIRFTFFNKELLEEKREETINLVNNNFIGINKIEELDYGYDIFFASKGIMNKVSTTFKKKYLCEEVRTKKIVGRDSLTMKDIWRHVLLINIINLKKNDNVLIKGKKYYIKALNKNDLVLRGLETGEKKVITYSIAKDYISKIEELE